MTETTKIWLIIAASLVLAGGILFVCVMSTLGWDFAKLSTAKYETNTYEIAEAFRDIAITTDRAHIKFALSEDGTCKVECYEEENAKHSVTVENDALVVRINNQKAWYDYIGFHFGSPKITVYLPKAEYNALSIDGSIGNVEIPKNYLFENANISLSTGNVNFYSPVSKLVKIKTSTGNICVENTSAGSIDLSVTTGKVTVSGVTCQDDITVGVSTGHTDLTDISCKSVVSSGTTGSISLSNVIAANKFSIERSTGYVKFSGCDADDIYVKTNTGNVTGSFLSNKVFITDTDVGSVDVPKTITGGRCEIRTDTGDIKIKIDGI